MTNVITLRQRLIRYLFAPTIGVPDDGDAFDAVAIVGGELRSEVVEIVDAAWQDATLVGLAKAK